MPVMSTCSLVYRPMENVPFIQSRTAEFVQYLTVNEFVEKGREVAFWNCVFRKYTVELVQKHSLC